MSHGYDGGYEDGDRVGPLVRSELALLGEWYADWVLAEQIGRLNRELFGPRLVDGTWEKGSHSCGECGSVLAARVAGGRRAGSMSRDGEVSRREGRRAQLTGLASCGSANLCQRCARKIRYQRSLDVAHVIRVHLAAGGGAVLLTYTFSHDRVEPFKVVMSEAMDCWRDLHGMTAGRDLKERSVGYIRNTEVTYGERNGVHPHHHVVWLVERPMDGIQIEALRLDSLAAWTHQARRRGRDVDPAHGVDAVAIRDEAGIGEYVSGIAMEMTRSDLKIGDRRRPNRSHWELAADASDHSNPNRRVDRQLWRELATAMRGHKCMTTSKGLWRQFGLRDETDEQIAAKVLPMETMVFFEPQVFRAAIRAHVVSDIRLWLEQAEAPEVIRDRLQKRLPMSLELAEAEEDDRGVPTIRIVVEDRPALGPQMGEAWREIRARLRTAAPGALV